MKIQTGLDRLGLEPEVQRLIQGQRVGLLAHAASMDQNYRHVSETVRQLAHLKVIFGPEHGYAGSAQDMVGVHGGPSDLQLAEQDSDPRIVSLYGESAADLSPRPADLADLDVILIDLQDVGSRYYTYVWTAAFVLRAAARLGIRVVVLDRPNPLGGEVVEGAPQCDAYRSFVGLYQLPIRHGLTIGEILSMVVQLERLDPAILQVVKMNGWRRSMLFAETGLPWILPSPNMPTPQTALVYPGGCLVEGTTLSEGRGTTRPFELLGAPGVNGRALANTVSSVSPGAILRPATFEPTVRKHAGKQCQGVQVHVSDPATFRGVPLYYRLIANMICQLAAKDPWRTEVYEYERHRPAMDLLSGSPSFRQLVNRMSQDAQHDTQELEDFLADDNRQAEAWQGAEFFHYERW